MKKAFIGTFWRTEKQAIKDILRKEKMFKRKYGAIRGDNGYLVIPESQAVNL